jgi:hypothetical protein
MSHDPGRAPEQISCPPPVVMLGTVVHRIGRVDLGRAAIGDVLFRPKHTDHAAESGYHGR